MPKIINLDALVVDTVQINIKMPDGSVQTFDLRDDFPVGVGFETMQIFQDAQGATDQGKAAEAMDISVTHMLGEIWRHTYPGTTDEQIAGLLAFNQRVELAKVFFTVLTARYKPLPSDSDAETAASLTADPAAQVTEQASSEPEDSSSTSLLDEIPSPSNSSSEPSA